MRCRSDWSRRFVATPCLLGVLPIASAQVLLDNLTSLFKTLLTVSGDDVKSSLLEALVCLGLARGGAENVLDVLHTLLSQCGTGAGLRSCAPFISLHVHV